MKAPDEVESLGHLLWGTCPTEEAGPLWGAGGGHTVPILRSWLGFKAEAKPHSSPVWAFIQNESCL